MLEHYDIGIYIDRQVNNIGDLSCGLCVMAPGAELPLHKHLPVEIYQIAEGIGTLLFEDEERVVWPHTSHFIKSHEWHGMRNDGDKVLKFFWTFPMKDWNDIVYIWR